MKTTLVAKALGSLVEEHLEAMQVRHYSASTLRTRRFLLAAFAHWCGSRPIRLTVQFRRQDIADYQSFLFEYRKRGGDGQVHPLSQRGQQMRLCAVRVFLSWLTKTGILATNPAAGLETPREEHRLPRQVLNPVEVERVLTAIPLDTRHGLRDRAMLETFYCCGIRRGELLGLTLNDIQRDTGLLRVNHGKGARDRVVPISTRALSWIDRYLQETRPYWITPATGNVLFVTQRGTPLSPNQASQIVRHWIGVAAPGKQGSCHILRHSCATSLLQHGADIRSIQQLLGHASLETTQLYTQVTVQDLKRVHERCHPLAQSPGATLPAPAPADGKPNG